MTRVFFDARISDQERRASLYAGNIFVYSATPASLELVELARRLAASAFQPLDPEMAQHELPVEEYAAILARLKPEFIHHPECKRLLPEIMAGVGCDLEQSYFDVPRLRTSTSNGYLTTGIAYAFHPHRDTWYSAPQCQLNWWLPVYPLAPDNGMTFFPQYFGKAVENSSHTYDYYRWNKESRSDAAKHISKDTRVQPRPEEPIRIEDDLRIVPAVGSFMIFSGAQLHASLENTSGRTRLSIDFRTVNRMDVEDQTGAENADSRCTGTSLRDFLRSTDLERLPEELVTCYDEEKLPPDAVKVYPSRPESV